MRRTRSWTFLYHALTLENPIGRCFPHIKRHKVIELKIGSVAPFMMVSFNLSILKNHISRF